MDATGMRIMILEDEVAHAEAVRRAFQSSGTNADIQVAGTLREYRAAVAARPPDIALLDLNLPDGRAVEVLTSPPEAGPFPVLIMTSYGNEQVAVEAMKSGALDYVVKSPGTFAAIPRTVDRALREWNLLQERKQAETALQESERMLRGILAASPVGIGLTVNRRMKWVNDSWVRMFGFTHESEYMDQPTRILYPSEEAYEEARGRVYANLEEGVVPDVDTVMQRKDGSLFHANVRITLADPHDPSKGTLSVITDISERKRMEQALRESEAWHRLVVENSNDIIWTLDLASRRFMFSSGAVERILGYPAGTALNLTLDDFFTPETKQRVLATFRKLTEATEDRVLVEAEHRHKNGSTVWLEISASLMKDDLGKPVGIMGVSRDITERKRAEDALQRRIIALTRPLDDAAAIRFSDLFNIEDIQRIQDTFADATGVASIITRPDGTPITRPTNFCRLCIEIIRKTEKGLANCCLSDAVIGRHNPSGPIVQPCLSGGLWDAGASITVGGKHIANWLIGQIRNEELDENRMMQYADRIGADPEEFKRALAEVPVMSREQFEKVAQALFSLANELSLRAYQNVQQARFITERKKAEALRIRLVTAVEQAGEAVVITDTKGNIQYVNPAFERISGYSRDEVIGNNPRILKSGYHDQIFYQKLWRTLESGDVWTGHFVNKRKDGTLYHEDCTISPVRARSGEIVNFVAVKRDISQEVQLEQQLQQAQKMEAIGTLAGGVAHDFNNLLQVVLGYSEYVLMDESLSPSARNDLMTISQAARNGADLVRRLLTFSRKTEIQPRPLNLNHQIRRVEKMLSRTIPKMINLELVLAQELATMNADPTQIEQILMNLAVNAKDAMPDGGRLTFETETVFLDDDYCRAHIEFTTGKYVLLKVTDTGMGMDRTTAQRIFEPFYTTKGPTEGTGLGLAVVYGIVKQHGGHILCYSEPGVGTTFKIYFPTLESPPDFEETFQRSTSSGGTETILLVDDEESIRNLGERILTTAGYKVLTARDGKEALEIYGKDKDRISLVVLDLIMPEMGGKQCLEELLQADAEVKIVVASGYSANGPTKEALSRGAKGFISKPFDMRQLLAMVRKAIDEQ